MSTTNPIVVAVKDSPQSEAALGWAASRARKHHVPLVILHVADDHWSLNPATWNKQLRKAGEELLTGSVAGALGHYGPNVGLVVVGSGSPHLGGTLTDRALQIAGVTPAPLAVVGTADADGGSGIVVGADGSELSLRAVEFAAAEADREGQELTVLHAYQAPDPVSDAGLAPAELAELMDDQERVILSETVAGLRSTYPDLVVHKVLEPGKEPVRALTDAAAGARMLVMGSHGRGGFARLILGSTTHGVLTHLPCPTVVVPPSEDGSSTDS